jgi:hypothetical protein
LYNNTEIHYTQIKNQEAVIVLKNVRGSSPNYALPIYAEYNPSQSHETIPFTAVEAESRDGRSLDTKFKKELSHTV